VGELGLYVMYDFIMLGISNFGIFDGWEMMLCLGGICI